MFVIYGVAYRFDYVLSQFVEEETWLIGMYDNFFDAWNAAINEHCDGVIEELLEDGTFRHVAAF